jgi:prepilin-type N-terminal cleavage/methylation domain-containing protein
MKIKLSKKIYYQPSIALKSAKSGAGFTLIELLVVVAIIALLAAIVLVGLQSSRQKARDVKRLGDMTQMNTALELYFATYKGYPSGTNGVPNGLQPDFLAALPTVPNPADGDCAVLTLPNPVPSGIGANTYYYVPSGTTYVVNGNTVYPDFAYYFCLGNKTGNFDPGIRYITPTGVK